MGSSPSVNNSSLYDACQRGDLKRVQELLPTMTYEKINWQGPDGNTALHCACEGNHKDIVSRLLDERDICSRSKLNKKGLTAYESTQSDGIRELFRRPSTSTDLRFFDENPTASLQPTPLTMDTTNTSIERIPDDWMRGQTNVRNAVDGQFMVALSKAPYPLKALLKMRTEREARENFESFLQKCPPDTPEKRERVKAEYDKYKRKNSVTPRHC